MNGKAGPISSALAQSPEAGRVNLIARLSQLAASHWKPGFKPFFQSHVAHIYNDKTLRLNILLVSQSYTHRKRLHETFSITFQRQ